MIIGGILKSGDDSSTLMKISHTVKFFVSGIECVHWIKQTKKLDWIILKLISLTNKCYIIFCLCIYFLCLAPYFKKSISKKVLLKKKVCLTKPLCTFSLQLALSSDGMDSAYIGLIE